MSILNFLFRKRQEAVVADIAARATQLVRETVRPMVAQRVSSMGTNEARGYVRARAGHLIREAIEMVTAHDRTYAGLRKDLVLEAVLDSLVRIYHARTLTLPATKRRAA